MKRFLILSLLLTLMLSASAFATQTRVMTMGDNGTILVDDANIGEFYGRVFNYPNLAWGEAFFGPSQLSDVGMTWKFGDDKPWVVGVFFGFWSVSTPSAFNGSSYGNFTSLPGGNRNIDLLYGRPVGNANFGFHFGYEAVSYEFSDGTDNPKESVTNFDLGAGLTDGAGNWDVAAFLSIGSWTDEDDAGVAETEADGYNTFGARGRLFHQMNPTLTLVPHAEAVIGKRGEKDNTWDGDNATNDINTESKLTQFELGLGFHYVPANNVLAVLDFGFGMQKVKNEMSWTVTYPPGGGVAGSSETSTTTNNLPFWKLGFEADVFSWMDLRMGATSDWTSRKVESGTTETKTKFASNDTYLGFGFNWGRLYVDTYTDLNVFTRGFDFISGNGVSGAPMNWQISALYEMF